MRSLRLLASLAAAATLAALPGCWPLAPIAAIAAAGGGGGGGGGSTGVALSGSVITDATGSAGSLALDREPNDTLGTAATLGRVDPAHPRRIAGTTAASDAIVALVDRGGATTAVTRDLLSGATREIALRGADGASLARRGDEIWLVRPTSDGKAQLQALPAGSSLPKRRVALDLALRPAGAAACMDALLVLDDAPAMSRLVAFDSDDGKPLFLVDLGRAGLSKLAGATELSSGRDRLFTCDAELGRLFEIDVAGDGAGRRVGALRPLPLALPPIAAIAYDGALLHVLAQDGTLASYDAALALVDRRPLLSDGAPARSLVASLDVGFDSWHLELPAGATLTVSLAAAPLGARASTLFLGALRRSEVARADATAPAAFAQGPAGAPLAIELHADATAPTGFDLLLGSRGGAVRYELALGAAARMPARGDAANDAATPLSRFLETTLLPRVSIARLVESWRDPLLPEFVPGRLLIGRDPQAAAALALPSAPTGFAFALESTSPSGFDRLDVATTGAWRGPAARTLNGATTRRSRMRERARELLAAADGLTGAAGVAWREPDFICHALATTPNDPGYAASAPNNVQKWAYDLLNLPSAWDITTGDPNAILAVVDTGIRTDNTDLAANDGGDGYDFVSDLTNADDGDGRDPDPFDEANFGQNYGSPPSPAEHHGSHVGGTMGARGNNNTQGSGICWNCELMAVRALGVAGTGSVSDIAEGMRYAARLTNASGTLPARRADVINLSLGTPSQSTTLHNALNAAISAGCVVCCAAGNDGNGAALLYPAAFPEAIAVAACDPNGNISNYSNTGPEVDITCPGGANDGNDLHDIWSTVGAGGANGSLQPLAGTSMACAHASGVCGLLKSVFPAMTQSEARALLEDTATDIETIGFDDFSGFGLVDAAAAVNAANPILSLAGDEVDFGTTGRHLVMQLRNTGGGKLSLVDLAVSSVDSPGAPTTGWLTLSPLADGKSIALAADRTGLAAGSYQIQVDVSTNGGDDSFLVDLGAGGGPVTDVGPIVIHVVAQDGATLVKSMTATAANGYAWSLAGVPRGLYFLRCGIDADHDGVLGELGEAYGAWPSVADESLLEIDQLSSLQVDLLLE